MTAHSMRAKCGRTSDTCIAARTWRNAFRLTAGPLLDDGSLPAHNRRTLVNNN